MAAVIVLEAIFEADLTEEQYAYRPQRSAHDAVRHVHGLLKRGYTEVIDADLSSYFDTIPHHELMKSVARRVSDGAMLALIKSWLEMAVEENDGKGNKRRTTVNKDSGRGTPQGAPISPLLANLYMRRFLLGWKQAGWDTKLKAHIVNYADDFVILCPRRAQTGEAYIGTKPSKKRVARLCEKISQMTERKWCWKETQELVGALNLVVKGWGNYFRLGSVSKAYRAVDGHVRYRLRRWLCHKHKVKGQGRNCFRDEYLYQKLGLFRLERFGANLPWATAQ